MNEAVSQDIYSDQFDLSSSAIFFQDDTILVDANTHSALLPRLSTLEKIHATLDSEFSQDALHIIRCHFTLSEEALAHLALKTMPIRAFLIQAKPHEQLQVFKAYHWINWDRVSRFCGQCGSALRQLINRTEKVCDRCEKSFFPRFSPAIMVLVKRQQEILLARSAHFKPNIYSAIAGFVDLGETAEMAVHREVKEETGLSISHLQYFASQTWPFPDSFMIAFTADYESGDLQIDSTELEDARWFHVEKLPSLPSHPSISRQLIDAVINNIKVK